MVRIRVIALAVPVLVALADCAPIRQRDPEPVGAPSDIHERLVESITRDGFSHTLSSQHAGREHYDVISIAISLDSLKARHLSLEKLMMDIGRICRYPNYAHLPIRIVIGAGDEDDQSYLYAILTSAIRGGPNISIATAAEENNMITITVHRPGQGR